MADYKFYAFFVASKIGKPGIAVTVDVYRTSNDSLVVNNQPANEIAGGLYSYTHTTTTDDDYIAVFKTTDGTVDQQQISAQIGNIADAVWDELLTGATHNIVNSAGRKLRQLSLSGAVIYEGTVVSATVNTLILDSGADSSNGAYDPAQISIVSGTGNGQTRLVLEYEGSTRKCVLDRNWKVLPTVGDSFIITANAGREHVNEGLIRAGTTYTCQLNANASSTEGEYVGQVLFIRSGTGEDQARRVISYDGATRTVTTRKAWSPVLDTTSAYVMLPTSELDIDKLYTGIADAVWDELLAAHAISGSAGATLDGDYGTAQNIWEYSNRTLTYSPTNALSITSDGLAFVRGDKLIYVFEDVTDLLTFTEESDIAYFTIKKNYQDLDSESIIQVDSETGLLILNGQKVSVANNGKASLTVDVSEETITLVIDADITKQLPYSTSDFVYDVELVIDGGANSDTVVTPIIGTFTLTRDVTRKIE